MKRPALALSFALTLAAGCGSASDPTLASRQQIARSIHCAGPIDGAVGGKFSYDLTVWQSGSAVAGASVDAGADYGNATVSIDSLSDRVPAVDLEAGDTGVWTFEYEPAPSRLSNPKPNVLLVTNSDALLGSPSLTRKAEQVVEGCEVLQ